MGRQNGGGKTRKASHFLCIAAAIFLLLIPGAVRAGEVSLAWDPPDISTDVVGYMIYHGTASGVYGAPEDAGNQLTFRVRNLSGGQTYYFAATAYNAVGYQSVYSNEVSVLVLPDSVFRPHSAQNPRLVPR